jgi:hypothetical protein
MKTRQPQFALQSDTDLLKLLQRGALGTPEKLSVIAWIWGVELDWQPGLERIPAYVDLEMLLRQSNQEFIDDMVRYGRPMRAYARNLWFRLLDLREQLKALDLYGEAQLSEVAEIPDSHSEMELDLSSEEKSSMHAA